MHSAQIMLIKLGRLFVVLSQILRLLFVVRTKYSNVYQLM